MKKKKVFLKNTEKKSSIHGIKPQIFIALGLSIALLAAGTLSGCVKTSVTPAAFPDAATASEAGTAKDTPIGNEEIKTKEKNLDGTIIIPDKFQVFTDGEPHFLMYNADVNNTFFNTFTSVSRPDLGIKSVSFISDFVDVEENEIRRLEPGDSIEFNSDEELHQVVDHTSASWMDDSGYGRWIPADGRVGLISSPFPMKGEVPTIEEVEALGEQYRLVVGDEVYADISEDGNIMYSAFAAGNAAEDSDVKYYGGITFRVKDGRAQGAYTVLRGDLKNNYGYIRYMMQSIRFED